MNYEIIKISLNILNFTITSKNIIDLILDITYENNVRNSIKFKITSYLGKGTIGQVYLLEKQPNQHVAQQVDHFPAESYVLKISNDNCINELLTEMVTINKKFKEYNINTKSYPIAYGKFSNIKAIGVIYNFLGYYNLEKIKKIQYMIDIPHNKSIIRQIIEQMKCMGHTIHCDLKPANIVINVDTNDIKATIIDYGLMKYYNEMNIISTNYITSPESLLTLIRTPIGDIDMSKHDYFGLFVIVINLFVKNDYWDIMSDYLTKIYNISSQFILKDEARVLFVYLWYKFNFNNTINITNNKLRKLILDIESKYKLLALKKFSSFDSFFNNHIGPNLYSYFNDMEQYNLLKSFLRDLSYFCPEDRPSMDKLLEHPFLN
jgi:serine/threonine protein kinase